MFNNLTRVILITCLLAFVGHFIASSLLSQNYESPKAMIYRLQRETEEMQARIDANPSSPDAERLKIMIQLNNRKIKEILPGGIEQLIHRSGHYVRPMEDYMVIAQKNLFNPLGEVAEVKQKQFFVTGIFGTGDRKVALIQRAGDPGSYYVAEGDEFGNGAKVASIEVNKVTIFYNGNRIDLKLGERPQEEKNQPPKTGEVEFQKKSSVEPERANTRNRGTISVGRSESR